MAIVAQDGQPSTTTSTSPAAGSTAAQPDITHTIDFLKALYPELPQGWVSWAYLTASGRIENRHEQLGTWPEDFNGGPYVHEHEWLAAKLISAGGVTQSKVFKKFGKVIDEPSEYGMTVPVTGVFLRMPSTARTMPEGNNRGPETDVRMLIGLVLDGDYGNEGHRRKDDDLPNPDTPEEVQAIWNAALGIEPTIVWNSGHGINGFWALKQPILVPDDEDGEELIARWKGLAERFGDRVVREAEDRDLNHDSVPDLNRLMRVPGTVNAKQGCKPVLSTLISTDGPRYTIEELEEVAPPLEEHADGSITDPISGYQIRGPRPVYKNNGPASRANGQRPGDHFNQEMWANGCAGFRALIEGEGFGFLGEDKDGKAYFERPGKEGSGENGASLGANDKTGARNPGAKFWSFSSNNPGLLGTSKRRGGCLEKFIDPFTFFAATQYDKEVDQVTGQFRRRTLNEAMSACARDLKAKGYGSASDAVIPSPRPEQAPDRTIESTYETRVAEFFDVENVYAYKPDQMGCAELFTEHLGGGEHLRWNDKAGKFYGYSDGHWNEDGERHTAVARKVDMLSKKVTILVDRDVDGLKKDLREIKSGRLPSKYENMDSSDAEEMVSTFIRSRPTWYRTYRSAGGRAGIIEYIKTFVHPIDGKQLDADPCLLNFANGTYDVRIGELRGHEPNDYLTHRIERGLDMRLAQKPLEEVAPLFASIVRRSCVAPGEVDEEVGNGRVAAFRRGIGATLHGSNPEKKLYVFKGASNTGKTVVTNVVKALLGADLSTEAKPTLFIRTRNDRHESEEYNLKGRRLVLVNELETKMSLDENQVLRLVNPSGSHLKVRKLREQQQDINITWSIVVTTNELLKSRPTQQLLNRMAIYRMSDVSVPDHEIDPSLFDRIMEEEADAVLAHLVAWWTEWYRELRANRTGLIITDEMRQEVEGFKSDNASSDQMFRDERTEADPEGYAKASEIFSAFNTWLLSQRPEIRREYEMGRTAFYKAVAGWEGVEVVYEHKKGRNPVVKGFKGVRLALPTEGLGELSARSGE